MKTNNINTLLELVRRLSEMAFFLGEERNLDKCVAMSKKCINFAAIIQLNIFPL